MTALAQPILEKTDYSSMPGWASGQHKDALIAFRRSCAEIIGEGRAFTRPISFGGRRDDWLKVCEEAAAASEPRAYFEANFTPLKIHDPDRPEGLFTGYFEPEARGSLKAGEGYEVPLYARPDDLKAFDESTAGRVGVRYGREIGDQVGKKAWRKAQIYFGG